MSTGRPLTVMCPWLIIIRDWARGLAEAQAADDVVQAAFQQAHQGLAGVPLGALGLLEILAELPFQHAVVALHLLLFAQVRAVVGQLAAAGGVHARRRLAAFDAALGRVAAGSLEEQLHAPRGGTSGRRVQYDEPILNSLPLKF